MSEEQKQPHAPAAPQGEGGPRREGEDAGGPRREGGPGGGRREGGPGGPGGRPRGKRQYFRKKKVCKFCVEKMDLIDYKRADILSQFVQERGTSAGWAWRSSGRAISRCCRLRAAPRERKRPAP